MSSNAEFGCLVIIGPPTSGKSSIARQITEQHPHIQLVRGKDILPEQTGKYEPKRELIPDKIFIPALINLLNQKSGHLILDNIPRTLKQTKKLLNWALSTHHAITVANLILTETQVVSRSQGREVCPTCERSYHPQLLPSPTPGFCPHDKSPLTIRPGDAENIVRQGYRHHLKMDNPILFDFKNQGIPIIDIDANTTVDQTRQRLITSLVSNPAICHILTG